MSGKANVEGRGRRVQRKELVAKDKHTAEGKKDGGTWRIRRATFDDLDAIMDINDNIYDGLDYMPVLFYTFMHSKLHAIYVMEEDGKLLSLTNCRFVPEHDDLVNGMSGRVRPSYQGRGYGVTSETAPIRIHLLKEHPLIRRFIADTMYKPNIAAKLNQSKILYHWNALSFRIADRQWLTKFTRIREMAMGAVRPFSLSYTNGTQWLERSEQLVRFISKYVVDFFPVGHTWMPTPTNKSGIRHVLSVAKVFVSLDPASTTNSNCPSQITHGTEVTGHLQTKGRDPQNTRGRGQDGDVIGLSYSTVVQCKYGIKLEIYFYGDCEKHLLSHMYSHLLHYVSISSDDVKCAILMHFPLTIDSQSVEERLKKEIGEMVYKDTFRVAQAVQFINDLPQAKL